MALISKKNLNKISIEKYYAILPYGGDEGKSRVFGYKVKDQKGYSWYIVEKNDLLNIIPFQQSHSKIFDYKNKSLNVKDWKDLIIQNNTNYLIYQLFTEIDPDTLL